MDRLAIRAGEIRGSGVGRRFVIRATPTRSLKDVLLRREFPTKRELWALRNVDLYVQPGEAIGIVGQNGSGKSTLLKLLAGIFAPSEGTLELGGRVGAMLELGAGFHQEFTGVENVYLNAAVHGLKRSYVDKHLEEIIAFGELEEFAHMPVKTYSSGMSARLGFSVAIHVGPEILLLDEVLAVGDEAFQQKCLGKIWEFKRSGGTIVFVSHNAAAVERLCDRAILLDHGRVVEEGASADVLDSYHHLLTHHTLSPAAAEPKTAAAFRFVDVRLLAADGGERDRFVEGEAVTVEIRLRAEMDAADARLTVLLRDESGRHLGSQMLDGLDVAAQAVHLVRLNLNEPPMRDGRFFLDVHLGSAEGSHLALRRRAGEFIVFSDEPGAAGPVRLGGTWEVQVESDSLRIGEPRAIETSHTGHEA
jgi:ABC-2 type transport system ATP-binding protein